MKKCLSMLLSVLLIGSLSGFTYANEPLRLYTNAANRAHKSESISSVAVISKTRVQADGTKVVESVKTESHERYTKADGVEIQAISELVQGAMRGSEQVHYKDGWFYTKLSENMAYNAEGDNNYRQEMTPEQMEDAYFSLFYDFVGEETLAQAELTLVDGQRREIKYRIPREAAQQRAQEVYAVEQEDEIQAGIWEGSARFDEAGRLVEEQMQQVTRVWDGEQWGTLTISARQYLTWPADKSPIDFPDDLDSYQIWTEADK